MNSSYEQKHPLYAASSNKRRKAMELYEGGERIEGNRAYLTRHTYESDKQYDIRASRATYRNFAAPHRGRVRQLRQRGAAGAYFARRPPPHRGGRRQVRHDRRRLLRGRDPARGGRRGAVRHRGHGTKERGNRGGGQGQRSPYGALLHLHQPRRRVGLGDGRQGPRVGGGPQRRDGAPRGLRRPAPLRNPDRLDAGLMDSLPPPDEGQGEHRVRHCRGRRTQTRARRRTASAVLVRADFPHDRAPRYGRRAVPDPAHLQAGLGTRQDAVRLGRPSAQCGRRKPGALGHVRGCQFQRPHEYGTGRHHRAVRGAVGYRVSGAGRSPCPRRGQRAGNRPSYGPSTVRRGRVRRVQGHRQNTARHAACQLHPAQRQRGSPLLEARRPVAWS